MQDLTNSDYRAHSAPLFSLLILSALDIFQVNSFSRQQLLHPTFLDLFVARSQNIIDLIIVLREITFFTFPCYLGYLFAKDNKKHIVVIILVNLNI